MSCPANRNVNFCDICDSSFGSRKDFLKHTLTSRHQKRARDIIMDVDEAEDVSPTPPQPKLQPVIKPQPVLENMEIV